MKAGLVKVYTWIPCSWNHTMMADLQVSFKKILDVTNAQKDLIWHRFNSCRESCSGLWKEWPSKPSQSINSEIYWGNADRSTVYVPEARENSTVFNTWFSYIMSVSLSFLFPYLSSWLDNDWATQVMRHNGLWKRLLIELIE